MALQTSVCLLKYQLARLVFLKSVFPPSGEQAGFLNNSAA